MELIEKRTQDGMPLKEEDDSLNEKLVEIIMMLLQKKLIEDKKKTPEESVTDRPEVNTGFMPFVSGIGG